MRCIILSHPPSPCVAAILIKMNGKKTTIPAIYSTKCCSFRLLLSLVPLLLLVLNVILGGLLLKMSYGVEGAGRSEFGMCKGRNVGEGSRINDLILACLERNVARPWTMLSGDNDTEQNELHHFLHIC